MSVATARYTSWLPLAPVAVAPIPAFELPPPLTPALLPVELDDDAEVFDELDLRDPTTPPTTAATMMATIKIGRPIQSHLLRFFFCGSA